jgi:hypothetical protein
MKDTNQWDSAGTSFISASSQAADRPGRCQAEGGTGEGFGFIRRQEDR